MQNRPVSLKEVRCMDCNNLLAYISEEESCIRIKYKDLFVKCFGKVEIICRRCGKLNTISLNKIRL